MFDPKNNKTNGYYLFLEPEGVICDELSAVINTLAKEYGALVFRPHITLLGRIPAGSEDLIIGKALELAALLKPITLTLGELGMEDAYFRAFYSCIREVEVLSEYRAQAQKIFPGADERPYLPHLSLLYGNYPQKKKEATAMMLTYPKDATFTVNRLYLELAEGDTSTWRRVGEFELK